MATSVRRRVERKAASGRGIGGSCGRRISLRWRRLPCPRRGSGVGHGAELVLLHVLPPLTTYVMADLSAPSGLPFSGRPGRPLRRNSCGSKRRSRDRTIGRARS